MALGRPVTVEGRTSLSGGCISQVERVETSAGPFVVKSLADGPTGLFEAEAAGLRALRSAASGLTVPRVVALDAGGDNPPRAPILVIEFLSSAPATADTPERLGRGLAELHRHGRDAYGFDTDSYCGTTRQPNEWGPAWLPFYRVHRLARQVSIARDAGLLSGTDRAVLDRLVDGLDAWLGEPASGPSLIHGDLWSGNLHVTTGGQPAILDPAVYYAHREAEFGIMTLFGGFPERVYEAYDEAFPLEPGWRDRGPLYQLYHLLNHLNLFGGGYHGPVMAIARRFA